MYIDGLEDNVDVFNFKRDESVLWNNHRVEWIEDKGQLWAFLHRN
jgi:hypothetical protein